MRERMRLLDARERPRADPAWLDALEARMAEAGAALAAARARTRGRPCRPRSTPAPTGPFPRPRLTPVRRLERAATTATPTAPARGPAPSRRDRDAAAGRALTGPHRGRSGGHPRRQGPSGRGMLHRRAEGADPEPGSGPGGATFAVQKSTPPNPILLLDEVAAHLDARGAPPCSTKSRRWACRPS